MAFSHRIQMVRLKNMQRTVKIKVRNVGLEATIDLCFQAYTFCIEKGFELKTYSRKKLHDATYYLLRNRYPEIPSALLQTIRDVACENLKATKLKVKPNPKSKFARYDGRTFSYKSGKISISTIHGRKKFVVQLSNYTKKYKDWSCKSAVVVLKKGVLWLNLIFDKESKTVEEPKTFLGIDRGIKNIAVCSDNTFYNSKQLKFVKGKYQYLKTKLQSVGTHSAKNHLKKLSGKEKRFVRDVNHCLSKQIANKLFDCFVLEDLKHLPRDKGRRFNRMLGSWSYAQFGTFLQYKAEEFGKVVVKVNPKYTSQMCSKCGYIEKANRKGSLFECKKCGFELNADLNASRNIANLGSAHFGRLKVIQPIVTEEIPVASLCASTIGR